MVELWFLLSYLRGAADADAGADEDADADGGGSGDGGGGRGGGEPAPPPGMSAQDVYDWFYCSEQRGQTVSSSDVGRVYIPYEDFHYLMGKFVLRCR